MFLYVFCCICLHVLYFYYLFCILLSFIHTDPSTVYLYVFSYVKKKMWNLEPFSSAYTYIINNFVINVIYVWHWWNNFYPSLFIHQINFQIWYFIRISRHVNYVLNGSQHTVCNLKQNHIWEDKWSCYYTVNCQVANTVNIGNRMATLIGSYHHHSHVISQYATYHNVIIIP